LNCTGPRWQKKSKKPCADFRIAPAEWSACKNWIYGFNPLPGLATGEQNSTTKNKKNKNMKTYKVITARGSEIIEAESPSQAAESRKDWDKAVIRIKTVEKDETSDDDDDEE
jgi:hypothetical protein